MGGQHKRTAIYFYMHFLERTANALDCINVVLFCSNHSQVSVTHVTIFRLVKTRIQLQISRVVRKSTFIKPYSFD